MRAAVAVSGRDVYTRTCDIYGGGFFLNGIYGVRVGRDGNVWRGEKLEFTLIRTTTVHVVKTDVYTCVHVRSSGFYFFLFISKKSPARIRFSFYPGR